LLWGGFSIHDATLHRFYSLHFALPFVLLILVLAHIYFLHEFGSSSSLSIPSLLDHTPFSVYYILKDSFSFFILLFFLLFIIIKFPDILGHPANFDKANFLVTPTHIVPE